MILKLNNWQTPCKRKGQEDRKYLCTFVFVSFFLLSRSRPRNDL